MYVLEYYNEFNFFLRQLFCKLIFKYNWFNHYIFCVINQFWMLMTLNSFSSFKFYFDCTEGLFKKIIIIIIAFTSSGQKHGRNDFSKSKRMWCTTVTSHDNSSKSNNPNTYNIDSVIVNSKPPRINIHTKHSSN